MAAQGTVVSEIFQDFFVFGFLMVETGTVQEIQSPPLETLRDIRGQLTMHALAIPYFFFRHTRMEVHINYIRVVDSWRLASYKVRGRVGNAIVLYM